MVLVITIHTYNSPTQQHFISGEYHWVSDTTLNRTKEQNQTNRNDKVFDMDQIHQIGAPIENYTNKQAISNASESDAFLVPNILHFIWFSFTGEATKFSFVQYLSVLSAYRFIKPDVIMFHTDIPPKGRWVKSMENL